MAKRTGGFIGQDGINAPDQVTGVTGTAGDGEVTVSFTAPSDVGGAAVTGYSVQSNNGDGTYLSSYDIASASYSGNSLYVASSESRPLTLAISSDGTKLYVAGQTGDAIDQWTLSTAFDVSTGAYDSVTFSYATTAGTNVQGMFFKPDGTKFYLTDDQNNKVYAYTMSAAWDLSTASHDTGDDFSVAAQTIANTNGIAFNSTGTKFLTIGSPSGVKTIFQYNLSTAWDITSASYSSNSLNISGQTGADAGGIQFNSDDTEFYVTSGTADDIFQYNMTTAGDLSSASYSNVSFSTAPETSYLTSMYFGDSGSKLYVCSFSNDTIFQYSTGSVGYPTSSPVTVTGLTNGTSYTFNVWAINPFGWSSPSDASGGVTPSIPQRGLIAGSYNGTVLNTINFIEIPTTGNATDFGDMTSARYQLSSLSNVTRGVFVGGDDTNVMDYVTIASAGNAIDFGDLIGTRRGGSQGSINNTTRGVYGGGWAAPGVSQTIQYLTFASTGNMTSFGTIAGSYTGYQPASCSSSTRGIFAGADTGGNNNQISYITISSAGNTTDFGDLYIGFDGASGSGNATRGIFAQGYNGASIDVIQYITIASTGNSTDFGDCSNGSRLSSGSSNATRSVINEGAASSPYASNTMGYITIGTTGNTSDFGDLTYSAGQATACSSSNGGTQ